MQRKMKRRWRRELKQKVVRYIMPAVAAAGIMLSSYNLCLAAPKGGTVTAGDGNISSSGNTTTITQNSDKLIIGWQSFDIGSGEKIVFVQPGSNAIALNRVLGSDATSIYGTLTANGRVFLINPNGILFSSTAHVDVGGLVASTLNISDADFLSDNYIFSGDGAAVVNQGTITASDGGYIVLLGSQANNEGLIVAQQGTVALGAGKQVTLDFYGDGLLNLAVDQGALGALAENRNLIQADGGRVIMTARAADALAGTVINNTGIVQARSIESKNGVIILDGGTNGTVNNNGTLDAGGGHVETSGGGLSLSGTVKAGDWLIDPTDITIDTTGAGTIADTLNGGGDVTIKTDAAADGNGDIFVDSPISWSTDRTLTLTAYRNVNVNADITATGNNAGLVVTPDNTHTGTGSYSLGNGTAITLSGATPSLSIAGQTYIVVNTLTGLQNVNNDLGNCYALGSNIDATGTQTWNSDGSGNYEGFVPIGTNTIFTGTFDGLGHTISDLYINRPLTNNVGLFGYSQGTIKNLGLEDGRITGNYYVGGLVGYNSTYNGAIGQITNSYNTGTVSGNGDIGGLVGRNDSIIVNSYNTGMVSGKREIGGLVGINYSSHLFTGSITNCYNTGAVNGGAFIGGLTGSNLGDMTDSYNKGAVNGSSLNVGGLAGSNTGTIVSSYNNASVRGADTTVGGLAGDNYGSIINSHNTGAASSGSYRIGGLVGSNG
ncbi:MAG TPA: filamentous hemagglutinin N-terminal domain-containing protein, partial [Bacillota bacterium]|nr:filamentous hemagglutinin N-terminal domain-containing protein [Bacillota bacterium]